MYIFLGLTSSSFSVSSASFRNLTANGCVFYSIDRSMNDSVLAVQVELASLLGKMQAYCGVRLATKSCLEIATSPDTFELVRNFARKSISNRVYWIES